MKENIYTQIFLMLDTLYGGIIIGFLYHTITILVYEMTKKQSLSDIAFWSVGSILLINLFFKTSYFYLRIYLILGFILGISLYYFIISPVYKKILYFFIIKNRKFNQKARKRLRRKKKYLLIKYKKPISKYKSIIKKTLNIPKSLKIRYNKFKNYYKNKDSE